MQGFVETCTFTLRVLAFGIVVAIAQQMRPAFGFVDIQWRIGTEKVADHHSVEVCSQQRLRHFTPARAADDIEGDHIVDKHPQPVRHTFHTPAGFIDVDSCLRTHQFEQSRIGRAEQAGDLGYHAGQFSSTEVQIEVAAQLVSDLGVAQAERDLLVDHEQQHVQSKPVAWQRGGESILVIGAAFGAPAPFDQVFGHNRRAPQLNVFDHALTRDAHAGEGRAAVGTVLAGTDRLDAVNTSGARATTARMTSRSAARARRNGASGTSGERLTLQFDQRKIGLVALGFDSREMSLRIGQLCAHLGQFGQHIAEQRPQLVAFGAHGIKFSTHSHQFRLELTDSGWWGSACCGVDGHAWHASRPASGAC